MSPIFFPHWSVLSWLGCAGGVGGAAVWREGCGAGAGVGQWFHLHNVVGLGATDRFVRIPLARGGRLTWIAQHNRSLVSLTRFQG